MIIIKDKFKTISVIIYLIIFDDLKYYLNLINYLRNVIHYYAQFINSL